MIKKIAIALLISAHFLSLYSMKEDAIANDSLSKLLFELKQAVVQHIIHSMACDTKSIEQLKKEFNECTDQMQWLKKGLEYKKACQELERQGEVERYIKKILTGIKGLPLVNKTFNALFKNNQFLKEFINQLAHELTVTFNISSEAAQVKVARALGRAISTEWLKELEERAHTLDAAPSSEWFKSSDTLKNEKPNLPRDIAPWCTHNFTIELPKSTNILSRFCRSLSQYMSSSVPSKLQNLPPLYLAPKVKNKFDAISQSILDTTKRIEEGDKTAKYRNILLWGPAATGKSIVAQHLADTCNLEYVYFDAYKLNGKTVEEVPIIFAELFDHIQQSPKKKYLIHIDDAKKLLEGVDENAFLKAFHASFQQAAALAQSHPEYLINILFFSLVQKLGNNCVFVLETLPNITLGKDVLALIDEVIEFSLPELSERIAILKYYRDVEFARRKLSGILISDEEIEKMAHKLAGCHCVALVQAIKHRYAELAQESEFTFI